MVGKLGRVAEEASLSRPGPILLIGAPGVGKGTQAKELMARWGVPQISTGDLLRGNVASGSALGVEAKQLMDSGHLVPNALVNRMVEERLKLPDTLRGYILDGYPRTIAQADWLDAHLGSTAEGLPLVAVSLRVAYTKLLRRVTGRRICPICGSIYNLYFQPPLRENVCDLDGSSLQRREDDAEAVFEGRMHAYEQLTAPVVRHYVDLGRLTEIDGEGSAEVVSGRVEAAVRQARQALAAVGLRT